MSKNLWTLWAVFSILAIFGCNDMREEQEPECTIEGERRNCGSGACLGSVECHHNHWGTECSSVGESCGECCVCVADEDEGAREQQNPQPEICDGVDNDCNGEVDEGCCFDYDGDGYYSEEDACGNDCDDYNPNVYPDAPEICDGVDNNCNGEIDEGFDCCGQEGETRPCGEENCTGHRQCLDENWTECSTIGESCGECDCTCVEDDEGNVFEESRPQPEECDGVDNDCNGETDEDIEGCCEPGMTRTCGTSVGECEDGLQVCEPTRRWSRECHDEIESTEEICDNLDNDCDDSTDEPFPCRIDEEEDCRTSCGTTGSHICGEDCQWPACVPPLEECNGHDDDCDSVCDDGYGCCARTARSCTTTCGSSGVQQCSSTCSWPSICTPPLETCNGRDDNCDGLCDEGYTCCAGSTIGCTTSCSSAGVRVCTTACGWSGTCVPPGESCNNRDDDCDGAIDESFTCRQGSTRSCATSCGTWGTQTCDSSCNWGPCAVPSESCNNADDDCDGSVDEIFTCRLGSSESCYTSCWTIGTRTCAGPFCTWGPCNVPSETCNNTDDDCDGVADEDFTCRVGSSRGCTTSCSTAGTQVCNTDCEWDSCVHEGEDCNDIDDDCDGTIDEGFACRIGSTRDCATSCGSTGTQTCNGSCSWGGCTPPRESCNGRDDDCDGTIDEGCCYDRDGDGYNERSAGCPTGTDCNDSSASIYPGALEVCNSLDDNCDSSSDNIAGISVTSDRNIYYTINSCPSCDDPCCCRATRRAPGEIYRVNFPRDTISRISPLWIYVDFSLAYKYYARSATRSARIEISFQNSGGTEIAHRTISFTSPRDDWCSTTTDFTTYTETFTFSGGSGLSHIVISVYPGDYGVKTKDLTVSLRFSC